MRFAALGLAVIFATSAVCSAQTYRTPSPATTSLPDLHAQAVARAAAERFHRGLAALEHGEWLRAAGEFEAIRSLHPVEPQGSTADYDAGIAYAHAGNDAAAAAAFRDALSKDPAFLAAMSNLIAVDLRANDVREARTIADRYVALAPTSARARYARGLAALAANDPATARGDFAQLVANDARYAIGHYDLGIADERLGRFDDALTEFDTALALSPQYARARFALATVLLRQGRRGEARVAFDRAARDARDDVALRALAQAMLDTLSVAP